MHILSNPAFEVVAGRELLEEIEAETKARVPRNGEYYASEELCVLQRERAARGIEGVEIIRSMYGHSVRYDSGLQNFALVRSGRGASYEDAAEFCRKWVEKAPSRRYAWTRTNTSVAPSIARSVS